MKRKVIALTLIRAGQSIWAADGRIQGSADLPLSDDGRVAVTESIALLAADPAIIHHPADEAATETANILAKAVGAKTRSVPELGDPNMGVLEGLTIDEFEDRFPSRFKQWEEDPFSVAPPEGEEIAHAADRIFNAIARILKRTRGSETAIVLHDVGLGLFRAWLADQSLNQMREQLKQRPAIERYAVSLELMDNLEQTAKPKQSV